MRTTPLAALDTKVSASLLAGALLAFATLASPAGASVIYTLEPNLIVNNNNPNPSIADANAEAANDPLFTNGVDIIGKWDFGTSAFEADDEGLFTDAAMTISVSGGTYTWTLNERTDVWDVVKIGIKQRQTTGYFLVDYSDDDVDNDGALTGTFTMAQLFGLGGDNSNSNLLDGWRNTQNVLSTGLSHITFFGSPTPLQTNDLPEPGAFGLLGLGLVGIGAITRRRQVA